MVKPQQLDLFSELIVDKKQLAVFSQKRTPAPHFVPTSSRSRETLSEYYRKLFARLRTAKKPSEIKALMNKF
jgi:hypothetical protein